MDAPKLPAGLDPDVLERVVTIEATTEHVEKMLHKAKVREFEFFSDEPPHMDGDDEYPYPLHYLTAAIGL
jgi:hypothetical protein